MKLSIIIPVYNEEKTIAEVVKKVISVKINRVRIEIIIVDDGSSDNSRSKIQAIKNSNIKLVLHNHNLGKGAAVRTGIKNAHGEYIFIQDADLEYNPKDIPKLLAPILQKKAEVVYGTRLNRLPHLTGEEKNPLFLIHYFGNRFLSFFTSLLYGQWITDVETGYKLFPKKTILDIQLNAKSFDFEPEITAKLLKKGFKILELPIQTTPRTYAEGKKLNTVKDGLIAFWTLLKYRVSD